MKIDIQKLSQGPIEVELDHRPNYFDLKGDDYRIEGNIKGELTFTLLGKRVLMHGKLKVTIITECVSCLEEVKVPVDKEVSVVFEPRDEQGEEEIVVDPEGEDISYYKGKAVIPDRDIRELILVDIPCYPHCKEDCRGLCPKCGANLNRESCDCKIEFPGFKHVGEEAWKEKLKNIM